MVFVFFAFFVVILGVRIDEPLSHRRGAGLSGEPFEDRRQA